MINDKPSVYMRIVDDVKRKISLGLIKEGEKLPSCRELGYSLGVNPNTVQRAYSVLEEQGVIYTLPKKGAYAGMAFALDGKSDTEQKLREIKLSGVTREELLIVIEKIYGENKDD